MLRARTVSSIKFKSVFRLPPSAHPLCPPTSLPCTSQWRYLPKTLVLLFLMLTRLWLLKMHNYKGNCDAVRQVNQSNNSILFKVTPIPHIFVPALRISRQFCQQFFGCNKLYVIVHWKSSYKVRKVHTLTHKRWTGSRNKERCCLMESDCIWWLIMLSNHSSPGLRFSYIDLQPVLALCLDSKVILDLLSSTGSFPHMLQHHLLSEADTNCSLKYIQHIYLRFR